MWYGKRTSSVKNAENLKVDTFSSIRMAIELKIEALRYDSEYIFGLMRFHEKRVERKWFRDLG
jgi:hypothetical protein